MYLLLFFTHCTVTFTFYVKLKKVDDALSIFLKNVLKYSQQVFIILIFDQRPILKKIPLSLWLGKVRRKWNRKIQNICVILNFPVLNFLNKGGIQLLFRNCVNYDSFATLVAIKSRNQQCKTFAVIFYIR